MANAQNLVVNFLWNTFKYLQRFNFVSQHWNRIMLSLHWCYYHQKWHLLLSFSLIKYHRMEVQASQQLSFQSHQIINYLLQHSSHQFYIWNFPPPTHQLKMKCLSPIHSHHKLNYNTWLAWKCLTHWCTLTCNYLMYLTWYNMRDTNNWMDQKLW